MKKLLLMVFMVNIASSVNAQTVYGESIKIQMDDILPLIILVSGILQIILFFKIWKMVDNVAKIRENTMIAKINNYSKADSYAEIAEEQLYIGNKEKAIEYFMLAKYRYANNFERETYYGGSHADEKVREIDEILSKL